MDTCGRGYKEQEISSRMLPAVPRREKQIDMEFRGIKKEEADRYDRPLPAR
jgi:hypothetical protein